MISTRKYCSFLGRVYNVYMQKVRYAAVFGIPLFALLSFTLVAAWSDPIDTPPNANVDAPINVGSAPQVKDGGLSLNALSVFGNSLFGGSTGSNAYLNFGDTSGSSGYGIRDNAGTLEFKNSGGAWASLQSIVYSLTGGGSGSGSWATTGSDIYNTNGGKVGINTSSPDETLDVNGTLILGNRDGCSGDCQRLTFRDLSGNADAQIFEGEKNNLALSAGRGGYIKFAAPDGFTPWVKISAVGMSIGMPYEVPDPHETLDVYGDASISGTLYSGNVSITNTQRVWFKNSGGSNDGSIWEGASGNIAIAAGGGGQTKFVSNGGVVWAYVDSSGWHNVSDARLKKNIEPLQSSSGLSAIEALRPVTFNWADPARSTAQQTGLIAQEVQKVLPGVVDVGEATPQTPDGTLSINYNAIVPSLIKAIQEQQAQIEQQQHEISNLKAQIAGLRNP